MHVPKYLSAESSLVLTSPCPQTPLSESVALTGVKNVKFLKGVILDSIPLHSRELHAGREKGPSSLWPLPGSHHRKVHSGGKRTGESPQREGSDGTEQNIPKGNRLRLGDPVLPKKKTRTSRTVPRLLRPRPVLTERHLAQDPAEQLGVMEGRRGGEIWKEEDITPNGVCCTRHLDQIRTGTQGQRGCIGRVTQRALASL